MGVREWIKADDAVPAVVEGGEHIATSEAAIEDGNLGLVLGLDDLLVIEGSRLELIAMVAKMVELVGINVHGDVPPLDEDDYCPIWLCCTPECIGLVGPEYRQCEDCRREGLCPECGAGPTEIHNDLCSIVAGNS